MTTPRKGFQPGPALHVLLQGWKREAEERFARGETTPGEATPEEIDELLNAFEARRATSRGEDDAARRFVRWDLAPTLSGKGRLTPSRAQWAFTKPMLIAAGGFLILAMLQGTVHWESLAFVLILFLIGILAGRIFLRFWAR